MELIECLKICCLLVEFIGIGRESLTMREPCSYVTINISTFILLHREWRFGKEFNSMKGNMSVCSAINGLSPFPSDPLLVVVTRIYVDGIWTTNKCDA